MLNILKTYFKPSLIEPINYKPNYLFQDYLASQHYSNTELDQQGVTHIFTYLDSAINNNNGDCVIFSVTKETSQDKVCNNKCIVLSSDIMFGSLYTQDYNKNAAIIREHFLNLHREFPTSKFIVICEANGHPQYNLIYVNDIKRFFGENDLLDRLLYFPNFQEIETFDILTTAATRKKMIRHLEYKLQNELILFHSMFTFEAFSRLKYQLSNVYWSSDTRSRFPILGYNDLVSPLLTICYYCDTYS